MRAIAAVLALILAMLAATIWAASEHTNHTLVTQSDYRDL